MPTKQGALKISGGPESWRYTVHLDGEEVPYVAGIDFKLRPGTAIPRITLEVIASVEFDGVAEVEILSKYGDALRRIDQFERDLGIKPLA